MSPHFKPNNSLCRKPVDTARRTKVRSRMLKLSNIALNSSGIRTVGSAALCSLTNEVDWIAVEQFVPAGVVEKNGHQISDFGATTFRQRQASKPRLNLYCSDLSQFVVPPVRKNPAVQIRLVSLL